MSTKRRKEKNAKKSEEEQIPASFLLLLFFIQCSAELSKGKTAATLKRKERRSSENVFYPGRRSVPVDRSVCL